MSPSQHTALAAPALRFYYVNIYFSFQIVCISPLGADNSLTSHRTFVQDHLEQQGWVNLSQASQVLLSLSTHGEPLGQRPALMVCISLGQGVSLLGGVALLE